MKPSLFFAASLLLITSGSQRGLAEDIRTRMNLPKTAMVYSAVQADIQFENTGTEPVRLYLPLTVSHTAIELRSAIDDRVLYSGPIETRIFKRGEFREEMEPVRLPPFKPKDILTARALLRCRWSEDGKPLGALFDTVGKFQIRSISQIRFHTHYINSTSEWSSVETVAPPKSELTAFDALQSMDKKFHLLDPKNSLTDFEGDQEQTYRKALGTFLIQNPHSYWSPFAHLTLAHQHRLRGDADSLKSALEQADAAASSDSASIPWLLPRWGIPRAPGQRRLVPART